MKTNVIKHFFMLVTFITVTLFTSCSEEDPNVDITNSQDITEMSRASEMDAIDVSLGDLVINAFESQEASSGRNAYNANLPECVVITAVVQQNAVAINIDFGTDGCLVNGHLIRGEIDMSYTRDPEAMQILINYTLVDFFFNNKSVEATRTILRERFNENGNPQFTHSLDITVTWPNGLQASRSGEKVREWIEGFGSGTFSDNVFLISGFWNANFVNGNSHNYVVMEPLRREIGCQHFVSGNIEVTRTNFGGVLDYGNGDCDALATFTFNNGVEVPINLN
jgi:hypothetical protein